MDSSKKDDSSSNNDSSLKKLNSSSNSSSVKKKTTKTAPSNYRSTGNDKNVRYSYELLEAANYQTDVATYPCWQLFKALLAVYLKLGGGPFFQYIDVYNLSFYC